MINRLISALPVVLPALLVLTVPFWLNQSLRTPSPSQEGSLSRLPDYEVENFSAVEMDNDGVARHMLLAKRLVHYPDDDTTDLEQPYFIETEPRKPAVQIKSDQAKIYGNNENIYLTGNVLLLRSAGKGRGDRPAGIGVLMHPAQTKRQIERPGVAQPNGAEFRAQRASQPF